MQSRLDSVIEVISSTFIGFCGCWVINWFVFKYSLFGLETNVTMAVLLCTVWSLLRGYMIRRHFNAVARENLPGLCPDAARRIRPVGRDRQYAAPPVPVPATAQPAFRCGKDKHCPWSEPDHMTGRSMCYRCGERSQGSCQ